MIPEPTIKRLCSLFHLLDDLEKEGLTCCTSRELESISGIPAYTIRKDLSLLGGSGPRIKSRSAGYEISSLKEILTEALGFGELKNACIVGLGKMGQVLLQYSGFIPDEFRLVAGFDSDVNTLELLRSEIPLYPSYEITDRVKEKKIELAIISVPLSAAQLTADRLIKGGIKGIVNFTAARIQHPEDVFVRNLYVIEEFRFLSSQLYLKEDTPKE